MTLTSGFDPAEYLRVVRDNHLHISQPALISGKGAWPVTRHVPGADMHRLGRGLPHVIHAQHARTHARTYTPS